MIRKLHQLSHFGNMPLRRKGLKPVLHGWIILIGQELIVASLQKASHNGRNRKAILRIIDGGLKKLGKGQLAKALVQLGPGAGSTRNGHRNPAKEGDFIGAACGMSSLRCQMSWCIAATI